jgi:ribosomal protein S21
LIRLAYCGSILVRIPILPNHCSSESGSFSRHRVSRTRRTAVGVQIVVGEGEPIGLALRRFKKQLECEGVPREMRRRAYFVDSTQARRAKRLRKRFKTQEAVLVAQMAGELPVASLAAARAEFWRRTGKP